jgi:hypothetical protein
VVVCRSSPLDRKRFEKIVLEVDIDNLPELALQCEYLEDGEDCRDFCYMGILKTGTKLDTRLKTLEGKSSMDPCPLKEDGT